MGQQINSNNTFSGGLITDFHALTIPNHACSDVLNMEIITAGKDQNIFQNIKGDLRIVELGDFVHSGITYKFTPLGVRVHNNIAYILAGAFKADGEFLAGTIGTFPSPDWSILNAAVPGSSALDEVFRPLHNFTSGLSQEGNSIFPFISAGFNFERNRHIDIVIQPVFDRSVNIIFTDFRNPIRIINSRFKPTDNLYKYEVADLIGDDDSNLYNNNDWTRIELIQNSNYTLDVTDMTVIPEGALKGGGYRYYFKYVTAEKNTTNVVYESPFFPVSQGKVGLTKDDVSNKAVRFTIEGLDRSYKGIQVLFAHFNSDENNEAVMEVFKIDFTYIIEGDSLVITHTGRETVTPVATEELNAKFTPVKQVMSCDVIHDRLALGGIKSRIAEDSFVALAEAAKTLTIWERSTNIEKDYSDPNMVISKLGNWPGEVYEYGVVFELIGAGSSPVFPITGMDNIGGAQDAPEYAGGSYPPFIPDDTGFDPDNNLANHKGVFRFSNKGDIYAPTEDGVGRRYVRYVSINTSGLNSFEGLSDIVQRFAIVRRKRKKNVLMQGMMGPTLKIPSTRASSSLYPHGKNRHLMANQRWVCMGYNEIIRLGMNYSGIAMHNYKPELLDTVFPDISFIPMPTMFISVSSPTKSWNITGNISQIGDSKSTDYTIYGKDVASNPMGEHMSVNTQHLAFYSCELDMNLVNVSQVLQGALFSVEVQKMPSSGVKKDFSPYHAFSGHFETSLKDSNGGYKGYLETCVSGRIGEPKNIVGHIAEPISIDRGEMVTFLGEDIKTSLIPSGANVTSPNTFTGKVDRNIGFIADWIEDKNGHSYAVQLYKDFGREITTQLPGGRIPRFPIAPTSRVDKENHRELGSALVTGTGVSDSRKDSDPIAPISLMVNSFSVYIGVKINLFDIEDASKIIYYSAKKPFFFPVDIYGDGFETDIGEYPGYIPKLGNKILMYDRFEGCGLMNVGHLANIYRDQSGRWSPGTVIDMYKNNSNAPYFAASDFKSIDSIELDVFRGDSYISSIFKRITYKTGIEEVLTATAADASIFGIGLVRYTEGDEDPVNFLESDKDDRGLNLFDNSHVLELASYSNINADIRSTRRVSDTETAAIGFDRDFYPNREGMSSDPRPDSDGYNSGYTGDLNPLPYFRVEEDVQFISTEFPNRILLTEKHRVDTAFNSFRDLKGSNHRDYGAEYGPIIKIVALKTILLSIHPVGILSVGVDERTLIAEGSDIFVDTAAALNPTPVIISEFIGSKHPESIVKTDYTVYGVDYEASAVWMFLGDKIKIISEFVIKTLLDSYKLKISTGDFEKDTGLTSGVLNSPEQQKDIPVPQENFVPRVYSTYNREKHNVIITYVAENEVTKQQYTVGTVVYNTVEQKWISRLSKGIKFSYSLSSNEYLNGVTSSHIIWRSDDLVDPISGKAMRNNQQGHEVPCEFEIVINEYPTFEKMLDNIQMVCNKNIPDKIVFTMFGEYSQAADQIWGESGDNPPTDQAGSFNHDSQNRIIEQPIKTREAVAGNPRLGILSQNAYYKNNNLYIEVGKVSSFISDINNKRIRDKAIRVRFVYTGSDALFIQNIVSILTLSSN